MPAATTTDDSPHRHLSFARVSRNEPAPPPSPSTVFAHDPAFSSPNDRLRRAASPTRLQRAARGSRPALAASDRRASARRGPAGVTLLENGGRNDGPPDLDELWRDFNRKLSGLFSGRGSRKAATAAATPAADRTSSRTCKSAGVGAALIGGVDRPDLARQRRLHRPGRAAGGHHLVRPLQPYGRCRLPVALPVPVPGARDGQRHAAALDRGRPQRGVAGDRPARLVDADPGREHRRHPLHRAVPAEGRARLPVREPRSRDGGDARRRIGGARDRRQEQDRLRSCTSSATRSPTIWCSSVQAQLDRLKTGILDRQRQRAERAASRAGAGRVRGHAEGGRRTATV